MKNFIQFARDEVKQLEKILKLNGVVTSSCTATERPEARIENIPPGARFNDPEISAALSVDVAAGLVACSQAMGMTMREDIGMMYGQFHTSKAQLGKVITLKQSKRLANPTTIASAPSVALMKESN